MIFINLLPHREVARKHRREVFIGSLGLAAIAGILICGAVYSWYLTEIESQRGRNSFLKTENIRLDGQIKDIAGLQAEIASLRARQHAVEDLQGNRNLPVYLLNELVKQLPDGVYLNTMKQESQSVLITGVAQSNERVSEVLRNFGNSPWLFKPELVEITAGSVLLSTRDQRRVANFTMRFSLRRATEPNGIVSTAATTSTAAIALPAIAPVAAKPVNAAPALAVKQ